jgi:hypothetical protein
LLLDDGALDIMRPMRLKLTLVPLLLLSAASVARAQSADPTPPGAPPSDDVPTPTHRSEARASSDVDEQRVGTHQLGARVRGIFVTHAMLSPYLADNTGTSMTSYSLGIEYIFRKENYDIVTSLDFSVIDLPDGNWLGSGHDPSLDDHYLQFRGVNFISADVAFIGYHKFAPWFELRYGGGLGLGLVTGDIYSTNNSSACNHANAADPTQCYPVGVGPLPANEKALEATATGGTDTAVTPHRHSSSDKPPVMGVVNLLVGFRFYPIKHMAITVEIGFRDAIFTGLGLHYLF